MDGENRRAAILRRLRAAAGPLPAGKLAEDLAVSRQIIVGDVALLRAGGSDIIATPRGYLLAPATPGVSETVACRHSAADTRRELLAIVDQGAEVVDVVVDHAVYGQLTGQLRLRSRYDVERFLAHSASALPLSALTGGVHLHTLRAADQITLDRAKAALKAEGFLLEDGEENPPKPQE